MGAMMTMKMLLLFVPIIALAACVTGSQLTPEESQVQSETPVPIEARSNEAESEILSASTDLQSVFMLPPPVTDGSMSVEEALASRRSRRNFMDRAISMDKLSQILWAAYGITYPIPDAHPGLRGGLRTTPSAGATFPLEVYVVVGNVEGLTPGVYRYVSEEHKLVKVIDGDVRNELSVAALGQRMVREAPASVFYSAIFSRITGRYGERGIMYAYIELGHSAQNVYLQVEALGLGTVAVGAFIDDMVRQILNLPENEEPLYIMPFGYFYGGITN